MAWRYIKDYVIVEWWKVGEYSSNGYEPVGGVAFTQGTGTGVQAMALYDDEVQLITQPKLNRSEE